MDRCTVTSGTVGYTTGALPASGRDRSLARLGAGPAEGSGRRAPPAGGRGGPGVRGRPARADCRDADGGAGAAGGAWAVARRRSAVRAAAPIPGGKPVVAPGTLLLHFRA